MSNTLTGLTPQVGIRVMEVARENAVTPQLITTDYSAEASSKGKTIQINVPNDFSTSDVTPGQALPTTNINDINPDTTNLTLDQWKKAGFVVTAKEAQEIVERGMTESLQAAIRSVINTADASVLGLYTNVYNHVGTAGTTPFASNADILNDANRLLASGAAPLESRAFVGNEFAYYSANKLSLFQLVNESGTDESLRNAMIMRGIGYDWAMNQNVVTHNTNATGNYAIDAVGAIGDETITIDNAAGALPTALVVGDIFTIAGSTQQHAVTSYTAGATEATVGIVPALDQVVADGDVITVVDTDHVVNLAFHRSAFHMATRVADISDVRRALGLAGASSVYSYLPISDPVSGLNLTLALYEAYQQVYMEVSMLYGVASPRPAFACRVLG